MTKYVLRSADFHVANKLIDGRRGCSTWDPPGFQPNDILHGRNTPFALAYGVTGDLAVWRGGQPVKPAGEDLEALHLQALAFYSLTGVAEGFPMQELDL